MNCEPMSPKSELLVTIVDGSQRRELIEDVLRIISEETGVPRGDLTDNSEFSSIGIDSLMTLLIASKIQEELNLPIESSTFVNFLTIGDLKKHLEKDLGLPQASTRTDLTELLPAPVPINPNISAAILDGYDEMAFIASHKNNDVAEPMVEQALKILSEETGIPVAELDDDTQFTTIGVDSFLSIMLVSRWNEEISLDIQTHLFGKLSSVKELKRYIRDMSNGSILVEADGTEVLEQLSVVSETVGSSSIISENSSDRNLSSSRTSSVSVPDPINELPIAKNPVRPATSIILQGQPRAAAKILILFPDGSGSAASYSQLPPIRSDLAVIVLNSPYYQKPEEMECHSLDNLIDSYLIEIRRRQPWGPYSLGGWSSGGIFAYRAAQRLIQEGEEVEDLVLIDAPVPTRGLDRLPQRWYDACEAARIFGEPSDKSVQQRLMKHFTATIEVLHDYHAEPLPEGFAPITSIIWASECLFDGVSLPTFPSGPEDPEGIKFLIEKRQDFSAGDWKSLFPGGQVTAEAMEGATHFSMMVSFFFFSFFRLSMD
jgi:thioesterase domain-containing protein/acyl carrier protein